MTALAYTLASAGFREAGWSFWQSLWWPYYLAKSLASREDRP